MNDVIGIDEMEGGCDLLAPAESLMSVTVPRPKKGCYIEFWRVLKPNTVFDSKLLAIVLIVAGFNDSQEIPGIKDNDLGGVKVRDGKGLIGDEEDLIFKLKTWWPLWPEATTDLNTIPVMCVRRPRALILACL
ncbi:uncharacterized protein L3040_008290 [Drepanopeziza brunnea f. sp. 'multigermtubi']|uniref:uncharacterized protein n=1 Tax=Drepanopeziza brunnea f. sp. 'multigermtubi' TaxID=698441 RepID=UPI0023974AA5|nr:hypothetical protein L3040_008290 [Drepanopeziza brunnea f. sp. 'multigermtubi']